jgi:uncharacterized repeat protein (TIGR04138 family)
MSDQSSKQVTDDVAELWKRVAASTGVPLDGIRFIYAAFDFNHRRAARKPGAEERSVSHCTGMEFCNSFVQLAEDTFGPHHVAALTSWGLNSSEKLGQVVFALVDRNLLGKQDSDLQSDFDGRFDFSDVSPALLPAQVYRYPKTQLGASARQRRRSPRTIITQLLLNAAMLYGAIVFANVIADYAKPIPLPLIFLVTVLAITLVRSWMRWPKRFSLRTLLIATTLVAVVLGLIVWLWR